MAVGKRGAVQSVTATIFVGTERHRIATVDWLSIRLSHGSDGEHHSYFAGGPPCWGGDVASTGMPVPRFVAVQPIRRVATGRAMVSPLSMTFESENRIICTYFTSSVISKGKGCNEDGKTDFTGGLKHDDWEYRYLSVFLTLRQTVPNVFYGNVQGQFIVRNAVSNGRWIHATRQITNYLQGHDNKLHFKRLGNGSFLVWRLWTLNFAGCLTSLQAQWFWFRTEMTTKSP